MVKLLNHRFSCHTLSYHQQICGAFLCWDLSQCIAELVDYFLQLVPCISNATGWAGKAGTSVCSPAFGTAEGTGRAWRESHDSLEQPGDSNLTKDSGPGGLGNWSQRVPLSFFKDFLSQTKKPSKGKALERFGPQDTADLEREKTRNEMTRSLEEERTERLRMDEELREEHLRHLAEMSRSEYKSRCRCCSNSQLDALSPS